MCMTKTHTKTYVNMDIQSTKLYMTKHTTELIQLVNDEVSLKMAKVNVTS